MATRWILLVAATLLPWCGVALADAKFEKLSMRLEHNVTDGDYEVVVEATGGDIGLAGLKVAAPDGRIVIDFAASNTKLGMRSFRLESPEPKLLAGLQADFPAGAYTFTANTVGGLGLRDTASLSHVLPAAARLRQPRPGELSVARTGLMLRWTAPTRLAACLVTIEHEKSGSKVVQAQLPGEAKTFRVPDSVLLPGTQYKVSIGTVAPSGNASFVETSFTTAKQ
jgi:hypothetical protein